MFFEQYDHESAIAVATSHEGGFDLEPSHSIRARLARVASAGHVQTGG
jgi:hypothetical protein